MSAARGPVRCRFVSTTYSPCCAPCCAGRDADAEEIAGAEEAAKAEAAAGTDEAAEASGAGTPDCEPDCE